MTDFEKLGVFYLGRIKDASPPELLLYDSRDLLTHAVCVGMTGSGKTGLCIGLLEEAAIDGIPALVIDPKGDLGNLLLSFPELTAASFRPWINEEDARRKGLSPDDDAAAQAALWKKGLGEWGQDEARIRRLHDTADFAIYTPGSSPGRAGRQLSLLKSFDAPPAAVVEDGDAFRDRLSGTAGSLLGLLGIQADPLRSREHILISTILEQTWRQGRSLDLAGLIQQIQTPPVSRIGILDLESFFPSRDRFELAILMNNLLASPGFESWMEGEPLDIGRLLYTDAGRPRVAIFSIAHLDDAQRMFFVSLLLNQTLSWVRSQSGTTSLRALLYMDEIFGYLPPVANPPSKAPLLTLLKQARAFGMGVVLATQNPVDLDYKALSNAGTWFIGRLQTERDKARVIEGLEGASAGAGKAFDRGAMERTLAGLGSRVFLMNNVHEDAPVLFETRWVMSYLRGPLTRDQIRQLTVSRPTAASAQETPAVSAATPAAAAGTAAAAGRPLLPPGVTEYFLPLRGAPAARVLYRPRILGAATVRFVDGKASLDTSQEELLAAEVTEGPVPVRWAEAAAIDVPLEDLETAPAEGAGFADLAAAAREPKGYDAWGKELARFLYGERKMELLRSPSLKEYSKPGESERDFRIRLQHQARERRDAAVEQLRARYASKIRTAQDRLQRAEQAIERESAQARQQGLQTAISAGAALLSVFTGRKKLSATTLGRAATAARSVGRSAKERGDVARAEEKKETLVQQLAEIEAELQSRIEELSAKMDPLTEVFEPYEARPRKSDVVVRSTALLWVPADS